MPKTSWMFLFLLVFSVYAEDQDLPVVASAKELKGVKAKKIVWETDGAKMVHIPANPSDTRKREPVYDEFGDLVKPAKIIGAADAFFMDAHEVNVGQFKKFLKSSGYKPDEAINWNQVYKYSPTDKHPISRVTWHDATAYAKWAGKRLPTEKEQEFAARGGLIGTEYSWGDDVSLARDYANYTGIDGSDKWKYTAPVGSFKPNGYGLHGMAGNVFEWCQNQYNSDQDHKVLRGGSWYNDTHYLRLANRYNYDPAGGNYAYGFRCVSGLP